MRYGIPDFKMDRAILDRRLDLLREEGIHFVTGVEVGGSELPIADLRQRVFARSC